jgi:hypothetical protein
MLFFAIAASFFAGVAVAVTVIVLADSQAGPRF